MFHVTTKKENTNFIQLHLKCLLLKWHLPFHSKIVSHDTLVESIKHVTSHNSGCSDLGKFSVFLGIHRIDHNCFIIVILAAWCCNQHLIIKTMIKSIILINSQISRNARKYSNYHRCFHMNNMILSLLMHCRANFTVLHIFLTWVKVMLIINAVFVNFSNKLHNCENSQVSLYNYNSSPIENKTQIQFKHTHKQ